MKKLFLISSILICLFQTSGAFALMVWIDTKPYSESGDFIIYNNTSRSVEFSSDGWTHSDIFAAGDIPPYSVRVDSDCDLKGSGSNAGTLWVSPTGSDVSWVGIWAHTEASDNQTYWTARVGSPGAGSPAGGDSSGPQSLPDTDSVVAQFFLGGNIMATFMVRTANDTGGNWTGNTKIILEFTDFSNVQWTNFCVTDQNQWYID